jgi:phenylpropionate dioxygenase-like ring-hydroxylating dioxygenase large terminal subunit
MFDRPTNIAELLRSDRVHASLYASEDVFAQENDRIWKRSWVYICHDSEVPNPGDYKRATLGFEQILVVRDSVGKVQAFYNRCRHRSNLLCQRESGGARSFRCPYHGWTYALDGELLAPTFDEAYDPSLEREDFGLTRVSRVDSYRGLVFANASADGLSLREHLGEATDYLDLVLDRSPVGKVLVQAGSQKVKYAGNWKMLPENSLEGAYHGHFIHKFAFALVDSRTGRDRSRTADDSVRYLKGGHMVEDFRHVAAPKSRPPHVERYLASLAAARGKERAEELSPGRAPIMYIFPNLMFVQTHFRTLRPVRSNLTYVRYDPVLLEGVEESVNEQILRSHEANFGPAGFLSPDDMEILERSQIAISPDGDEWLFIGRGVHREITTEFGGSIGHCMDENHLRGFWRHYAQVMA